VIKTYILITGRDVMAIRVPSDQDHPDAFRARETGDRLILARLKILRQLCLGAVPGSGHRDRNPGLILDLETTPTRVGAARDD
jgi:hypothetical protein